MPRGHKTNGNIEKTVVSTDFWRIYSESVSKTLLDWYKTQKAVPSPIGCFFFQREVSQRCRTHSYGDIDNLSYSLFFFVSSTLTQRRLSKLARDLSKFYLENKGSSVTSCFHRTKVWRKHRQNLKLKVCVLGTPRGKIQTAQTVTEADIFSSWAIWACGICINLAVNSSIVLRSRSVGTGPYSVFFIFQAKLQKISCLLAPTSLSGGRRCKK